MKNSMMLLMLLIVSIQVSGSIAFSEVLDTPEGFIITHYPDRFDGTGIVDSIKDDGIVINDTFYPYAIRMKYSTPYSEHSSGRSFSYGDPVGYRLDEDNQITHLYLFIKEKY